MVQRGSLLDATNPVLDQIYRSTERKSPKPLTMRKLLDRWSLILSEKAARLAKAPTVSVLSWWVVLRGYRLLFRPKTLHAMPRRIK